MDFCPLTTADLTRAHEAADYLLGLRVRLDRELAIKLDTFQADLTAEIGDRQALDLTARREAKSALSSS